MNFTWKDYNPEKMQYVEKWLDKKAIRMTGMDDGWRDFYEYWANEEGFVLGENYWCKVVFEDDKPFAIMAIGLHDDNITIMETLV